MITFIQVCRLLLDYKNWHYTGYSNEVGYKNTGYVFWLKHSCISLYKDDINNLSNKSPRVFVANFLQWHVLCILCIRIRRHLKSL